jgi:hypothetical protein
MTDTPKKTLKIIRKPTLSTAISDNTKPIQTDVEATKPSTLSVSASRKPIQLKPKSQGSSTQAVDTPTPTLQRPKKRVITPVKPVNQNPVKKPAKPKPPKKKHIKPPSDIRAKELDASLNAFPMWRDRKPLALNFERQVFQHIGKHHLSASKRVVMKLLEWHTANRFYLQAVSEGGKRFNLDGSEADTIQDHEIAHALNKLAKRKK